MLLPIWVNVTFNAPSVSSVMDSVGVLNVVHHGLAIAGACPAQFQPVAIQHHQVVGDGSASRANGKLGLGAVEVPRGSIYPGVGGTAGTGQGSFVTDLHPVGTKSITVVAGAGGGVLAVGGDGAAHSAGIVCDAPLHIVSQPRSFTGRAGGRFGVFGAADE